ncbi:hypothetical protein [Microcystis phage MaeS]|nr:hypothetical protein [Microcystis phage MaeS]
MKIGAIYARASTDKQGDTVEHQVQMIKEYVKRINDSIKETEDKITIDDKFIYIDEGESGFKTTLLQRDEMRKLMSDIDNKLVDVVFFKGISRFARDAEESFRAARKFKEKNIRVISLEENYDSLHSDPMMFQFYSIMAEQESRKTSIRVSLGNKQKARNGLFVGSVTPYGYSRVKDIKDDKLRKEVLSQGRHEQSLWPDKFESEIVKFIFEKVISENLGRKKIAMLLNQKGIRTRDGNRPDEMFIKRILENEVYTGDIIYGKTRYEYIEDEKTNRKVQKTIDISKDEWIISRNSHPAIIERGEFMEAHRILHKRSGKHKGRRFNNARHPLTGILKCGKCGAPMICQKRSNKRSDGTKIEYRYYVCSTYHRQGRDVCAQANINADSLEEHIHQAVSREVLKLKEDGYFDNELQVYNQNEEINKEITQIDDTLDKYIIKLDNLLDHVGLYDKDTFRELNNKIKTEIVELRTRKEYLLEQLSFGDIRNNEEELRELFDSFLNLNLNDLEESRNMFHSLLNEVTVDGNKIKIDAKFNLIKNN